jgi:hypothetical protein
MLVTKDDSLIRAHSEGKDVVFEVKGVAGVLGVASPRIFPIVIA